uniref:W2 domain-containing protein n=1 Tax=Euplotes crassus TaxID=5936 RepID=A0A7S3KVB2_EUPCR|mmetsp:Transcript_9733/g.9560  ORF Transcript_9733/g.9560 Transcript_9733/m.9560 type:complete len:191 (+) Transcript_9733:815-1387(+)
MNTILLTFQKSASIFTSMIEEDGEEGTKCFIMSMVNFFITQRPDLDIAIAGFCKVAYDSNIISEEVFLAWADKKFKTDKKSSVYDKKAEKKFRKAAQKFLTWLQEAEEDEGEESEEEEEENEELTEEQKKAKKMEQLIKEEKLKQEQALAESKAKADEEEKQQEEEGQKIDLMAGKADVAEEDDFDIDDI